MHYLVVEQRVADPEAWCRDFNSVNDARRAAGGGQALLLSDPDDYGLVIAVVPFDSAEHALAWRNRPGIEQQLARHKVDPASVRVRVLNELTF